MILDTLTFDIETIPQQAPLTVIQQEELNRQLDKYFARMGDISEEDKAKATRLLMATNPYFGEIICIGLHRTVNDLYDSKALVGEEKSILERFWKILESFKGIFISFNGLNFDVPFILKRSMKYNILFRVLYIVYTRCIRSNATNFDSKLYTKNKGGVA